MQEIQFISGLPRSGTSLLASILRQNPKFWSHVESPLGQMFVDLIASMGLRNETYKFITDEQRRRCLEAIFSAYYRDVTQAVVFDNNRKWCANLSALCKVFTDVQVLTCVRSPAAIVDSFEKTIRAYPLYTTVIFDGASNLTVYDRLNRYMAPDGVIGWALKALRDAYFGPDKERLILIRYDDLAQYPGDVMKDIHDKLGEAPFEYNFKKIEQLPGVTAFDEQLGMPGLHKLQGTVSYDSRPTILPPDIAQNLPVAFWDVQTKLTKAE